MKPSYFSGVETEDGNQSVVKTAHLGSGDVVMSITFDDNSQIDVSTIISRLETIFNAFRQFAIISNQSDGFCIRVTNKPLSEKQIHLFSSVLENLFSLPTVKNSKAHLLLQENNGNVIYDVYLTPYQSFDSNSFLNSLSPTFSAFMEKTIVVQVSQKKFL